MPRRSRRGGKYYWYMSTDRCGIGVAVSTRPEGPYTDALGHPLLTNKDCFASSHSWACIDPTVMIDDDGQAWLFWGNGQCYYVKLKDNMVETDGPVRQVKRDGLAGKALAHCALLHTASPASTLWLRLPVTPFAFCCLQAQKRVSSRRA